MNPSNPVMSPGNSQNRSADHELVKLEQSMKRQAIDQKRSSTAVFLVSASMLVLIIVFGLVNYRYFKNEWTQENFTKSIEREFEELNPEAIHQLQQLGQRLLPIYVKEGKKQFLNFRPEITKTLLKQVDVLSEDLKRDTHERLLASESKMRVGVRKIIFETFPDMNGEHERLALDERIREVTKNSVTKALAGFEELFAKDVAELRLGVDRFAVEDKGETTVELQKRFISLWLQLLDEEIKKL